jgi:hypothetical protein
VLTKGGMTSNLLVLGFLTVGSCYGLPVFGETADLTGSRSEPVQIITGGDYSSDGKTITVSWIITPNGNLFDYQYTISGFDPPGISHFIISLSPRCSEDPGCITGETDIEYGVFDSSQGNSNPGIPAAIDGVKFDFGTEDPSVYTFTSNRAPVWGDFYFNGGNDSFAYNAGLPNHASENILDFIARPDTTGAPTAEIPEPGTWALLASGVAFVALGRKKLFNN